MLEGAFEPSGAPPPHPSRGVDAIDELLHVDLIRTTDDSTADRPPPLVQRAVLAKTTAAGSSGRCAEALAARSDSGGAHRRGSPARQAALEAVAVLRRCRRAAAARAGNCFPQVRGLLRCFPSAPVDHRVELLRPTRQGCGSRPPTPMKAAGAGDSPGLGAPRDSGDDVRRGRRRAQAMQAGRAPLRRSPQAAKPSLGRGRRAADRADAPSSIARIRAMHHWASGAR